MAKIHPLFPAKGAASARSFDVTCLALDSIAQVRFRVSEGVCSVESSRTVARVLRATAQLLIESMLAQPARKPSAWGLSHHHAGRRAIELLDLAQELDDARATKEGS